MAKKVKSVDGRPTSSKYQDKVADAATREQRRKLLQRIYDRNIDLEAF